MAVRRGDVNLDHSVSEVSRNTLVDQSLRCVYENAIVSALVLSSMESAILTQPELSEGFVTGCDLASTSACDASRSRGGDDEEVHDARRPASERHDDEDDVDDEIEYIEFRKQARLSIQLLVEDDTLVQGSSELCPTTVPDSMPRCPDSFDVLAPLYGAAADAALAQKSAPSTPSKMPVPQRPAGDAPPARPVTGAVSREVASSSSSADEATRETAMQPAREMKDQAQAEATDAEGSLMTPRPPAVPTSGCTSDRSAKAKPSPPMATSASKASSVCSQQSSRDLGGQVDTDDVRKHDQRRLRERFLQNLQKTRCQEEVGVRRSRVLQEYHWIMKDMQVERDCRKQEREWQRRQVVRHEQRERQRNELLQQSEQALNLRYGRIMQPPVDLQLSAADLGEGALTHDVDVLAQAAPIVEAPVSGGDVLADEAPIDEALDLFVRTYREATGRTLLHTTAAEESNALSLSPSDAPPASTLGEMVGPVGGGLRPPSCQSNLQKGRGSNRKSSRAGCSPGKAAWTSQRNPWRSWHASGAVNALPSMDVAVSSLLARSLPPLPEGAEQAETRDANSVAGPKRQPATAGGRLLPQAMILSRPRAPLPSVPQRCLNLHQSAHDRNTAPQLQQCGFSGFAGSSCSSPEGVVVMTASMR